MNAEVKALSDELRQKAREKRLLGLERSSKPADLLQLFSDLTVAVQKLSELLMENRGNSLGFASPEISSSKTTFTVLERDSEGRIVRFEVDG